MQNHTYAVIGAGNMGCGIAQKIASAGATVRLVDADLARAEAGKQRMAATLHEGVQRKLFSEADAQAVLARVLPTGKLEDLGDCALVVEAVFEDLGVKRDLFTQLGQVVAPDCILATNTSSFLVKDLAAVTAHPERVVGLHYFYHPAKNRLVEVIGHVGTSKRALDTAWQAQLAWGKTPIASADAPGFVVNRFFVPWVNEAVRLFEEGHPIAAIEAAAKQSFGVGMGPFELMNVTGVPISLHAAASLSRQLGAFYAPAASLQKQVEAKQPWILGGADEPARHTVIADRLWGVVFHVAATLVAEKVGTLADTDLGARVGLRWPVGPFEKATQLGVARARELAAAVEARYGLPAATLFTEGALRIERVKLEVHDGVATITVNRPDSLNALDPDTLVELEARFIAAEERGDVRGIVITGAGKAFVAGADVKYFVDKLSAKQVADVAQFAADAQRVFRRIEKSQKRVVACVDGLALGGGAELVLACHSVVATPRARFAFPETGLGIYPGLGGTQRLTRRLGKGLARYYLYTGTTMTPEEMAELSLAWRVVPPEELGAAVKAALTEAPVQPTLIVVPDAFGFMARFLEGSGIDGILDGSMTLPGSAELTDLAKKVRRKAPLAIREVERLTEIAAQGDLEKGLAAETAGIAAMFGTADALEGMRALLEKRHPQFVGA